MTTSIRTVYGRFEVRQWWMHIDRDGDTLIVSGLVGDVCPESESGDYCDPGHLPEYAVYEEMDHESPQMHVCDAPTLETAQRIARALDIEASMDSNGDVP